MSKIDMGKLVIGTAGLGLNYGVPHKIKSPISPNSAKRFIQRAYDCGIKTFDTAPIYGDAEAKLGETLGGNGSVWTKCGPIANVDDINTILKRSFCRLNRDVIDLLQWHFWTPDVLKERRFDDIWCSIINNSNIKLRGATTYGVYNALSAVKSGMFDVVQVEWNLLNQNVLSYIGDLAKEKNTKIAVRSVLLKGILTSGMDNIPEFLMTLGEKIYLAKDKAKKYNIYLEQLAMMAALINNNIDYVIVGVSSNKHLDRILEIPSINREIDLNDITELNYQNNDLTDTRVWEIL